MTLSGHQYKSFLQGHLSRMTGGKKKKQNGYALEALTRLKYWRVIVIAEQKPELVHVHKMI